MARLASALHPTPARPPFHRKRRPEPDGHPRQEKEEKAKEEAASQAEEATAGTGAEQEEAAGEAAADADGGASSGARGRGGRVGQKAPSARKDGGGSSTTLAEEVCGFMRHRGEFMTEWEDEAEVRYIDGYMTVT